MTAGPPSVRAAVRLEHATIAWNTVEVFVTIGLGIAAGSLALIAFGLDSIVEIFASGVVLWNLRGVQDEGVERQRLGRIQRLAKVVKGPDRPGHAQIIARARGNPSQRAVSAYSTMLTPMA